MDLKAENAQLLKEVEDNAKLISSMETRLGHGEFDTSTSKVFFTLFFIIIAMNLTMYRFCISQIIPKE